jgi:ABC-type transporter Mla subunit MlaD
VARNGALRKALTNVEELTGEGGRLQKSLANVEALTGPKSDLAKTMVNAERFTSKLANNSDIDSTLKNFRTASGNLNRTVSGLGTQFSAIGSNLEQADRYREASALAPHLGRARKSITTKKRSLR